MPASTNKKILIRRFDRESVTGFVNPQTFLQPGGIEVLSPAGNIAQIPYSDIKTAYFVRDFTERPGENRVFNNRPKTQGVWIRLQFKDGDVMEGLIPNNLLQLEPYGFNFAPPNPTSMSQRVFVPRAALSEVVILGVIGSPARAAKPKPKEQIELFSENQDG